MSDDSGSVRDKGVGDMTDSESALPGEDVAGWLE